MATPVTQSWTESAIPNQTAGSAYHLHKNRKYGPDPTGFTPSYTSNKYANSTLWLLYPAVTPFKQSKRYQNCTAQFSVIQSSRYFTEKLVLYRPTHGRKYLKSIYVVTSFCCRCVVLSTYGNY